jgi:diacylglycerol diphosphate phosphatase / phosphatidate phosphatase
VLLTLAPLIGAALIAISRLEDYRHDVWDVTCGSILGMATAYFSYRRYFPPLHSPRCNEPYPSRATVALLEASGRMKDDEEVQNAADFELDGLADEEDASLNHASGSGSHQPG